VSDSAIDVYERVEFFLGLLAGPLLYLYSRSSLREEQLSRRDAVHALPTFVLLIGLPSITLLMAQQFGYTAATAWLFLRSETARTEQKIWPRRLIVGFVTIHVAQLIRLTLNDVAVLRNIVPTAMSVVVLTVAVSGFRTSILRSNGPKYAKSPLPEEADSLMDRLQQVIAVERAFVDPSLSLDRLAQKLEVPPHLLSRLLNDRLGVTFYEYVNKFRVEELSLLLKKRENDRYTIDSLAERSGFASRSGFYSAFKRYTGMTPTEYRRRGV
jgi:AraC-like DNA-binding protein